MEGSEERTDNASQTERTVRTEGEQSGCSLVNKWADVGCGLVGRRCSVVMQNLRVYIKDFDLYSKCNEKSSNDFSSKMVR